MCAVKLGLLARVVLQAVYIPMDCQSNPDNVWQSWIRRVPDLDRALGRVGWAHARVGWAHARVGWALDRVGWARARVGWARARVGLDACQLRRVSGHSAAHQQISPAW